MSIQGKNNTGVRRLLCFLAKAPAEPAIAGNGKVMLESTAGGAISIGTAVLDHAVREGLARPVGGIDRPDAAGFLKPLSGQGGGFSLCSCLMKTQVKNRPVREEQCGFLPNDAWLSAVQYAGRDYSPGTQYLIRSMKQGLVCSMQSFNRTSLPRG